TVVKGTCLGSGDVVREEMGRHHREGASSSSGESEYRVADSVDGRMSSRGSSRPKLVPLERRVIVPKAPEGEAGSLLCKARALVRKGWGEACSRRVHGGTGAGQPKGRHFPLMWK